MRVALVYDAVYPWIKGGAERRIAETAVRLARNGHDVHLFGIDWWGGPSIIEQNGVTLHGVCKVSGLYTPGGRRSIGEALIFGSRLLLPLSGNRFDIIDISVFPYFSCFSAKAASLLHNTPMAITWHEVWGSYWREYLGRWGYLGELVEKSVPKLCKNHISVSESTRSELIRMGIPATNVHLVPNGVDLDGIVRVTPSGDSPEIIFVGRLIREKNVDILIKAIGLVRKEIPDVRCGIIGDGPERERLSALADRDAAGNVELFGNISDSEKISMLKSAKIFVFPSIREGFGMAVLEAMACGLPVITTDHPMNASANLISRNGFKGELSVEFIADKILELLLNPGKRREMSAFSISYSRDYDWNNIAKMLERTYSEIVQ
jgi:glycosyltransferase involved in cell wall biosynthesis